MDFHPARLFKKQFTHPGRFETIWAERNSPAGMKYYSKSPRELRESLQKDNEGHQKARKRSFLFQGMNIALILMMILFVSKIFRDRPDVDIHSGTNHSEQKHDWKGWQIKTRCAEKLCRADLERSPRAQSFASLNWQVKEKNSLSSLLEQTEKISGSDRKLHFEIALPFPLQLDKQVFLIFRSAEGEEILKQRIYPVIYNRLPAQGNNR